MNSGSDQPGADAVPCTCVRCGYDLRGLRPEGLCPECGTPVEHTVNGPWLRLSSPTHLRTLRIGASLVLWSFLAEIVALLVCFILVGFNLPELCSIAIGAATSLALAGFWLLSAPDPRLAELDRRRSMRGVIRVFVVMRLALWITCALVSALWTLGGIPMREWQNSSGTLYAIETVCRFGMFFPCMLNLKWLAFRLEDLNLARQCGQFVWLAPMFMGVGMLLLPTGAAGPVLIAAGGILVMVLYFGRLELLIGALRRASKAAETAGTARETLQVEIGSDERERQEF